MLARKLSGLSSSDIKFLIETVDPGLLDKMALIQGDPLFVDRMLDDAVEKLYQRIVVLAEDRILTQISPLLLFEVLLRKTSREIGAKPYIMERTAGQRLPVFDTKDVADFLKNKAILRYLADMLNSFTKTQSFTLRVRVRKGIWRKLRFSDMDLNSLLRICRNADDAEKFVYFKRIADLCLFILGIFPEYASSNSNYFHPQNQSNILRPVRPFHDFALEGPRFYKLAAQHTEAKILGLEEVFTQLHQKFMLAKRPLNYISDNYLVFRRQKLFPSINN
jgi:hypothetical protein